MMCISLLLLLALNLKAIYWRSPVLLQLPFYCNIDGSCASGLHYDTSRNACNNCLSENNSKRLADRTGSTFDFAKCVCSCKPYSVPTGCGVDLPDPFSLHAWENASFVRLHAWRTVLTVLMQQQEVLLPAREIVQCGSPAYNVDQTAAYAAGGRRCSDRNLLHHDGIFRRDRPRLKCTYRKGEVTVVAASTLTRPTNFDVQPSSAPIPNLSICSWRALSLELA